MIYPVLQQMAREYRGRVAFVKVRRRFECAWVVWMGAWMGVGGWVCVAVGGWSVRWLPGAEPAARAAAADKEKPGAGCAHADSS